MKRTFFALYAAFFMCVFAHSARAEGYVPIQSSVTDLQTVATGKITEVLKPDLIKLDSNIIYRLDGIRFSPKFRAQIVTYLQDLVKKGAVRLLANPTIENGRYDRTGAVNVHAVTSDGIWIQEDLIKKGFAWVQGTVNNRDMLIYLIKAEDEAIKNKQGLWSDPANAVRTKDTVGEYIDSFQIVEGRAISYKCFPATCFVNFEADFKKDFTISLDKTALYLLESEKSEIADVDLLTKKTFRIRGWVEDKNGPAIALEYPEQIEFLASPPVSQ